MKDDIYVILRSANERSLPLAEKALALETSHYSLLEAYPFSKSLHEMFKIGKDLPFPYLLALDADVILHSGILKKIMTAAPSCEFFLDFFVMDKFRGKCCSGCHLYLNKYSKALFEYPFLPNASRPENHLVLHFAKTHHLKYKSNSLVVGLHDYEQYYKDLYAKYYRRALRRKGEAEMLKAVIEARKAYFPGDKDFEVVLKGLSDGIKADRESFPLFDAKNYPPIESLMPLSEKLPLKR